MAWQERSRQVVAFEVALCVLLDLDVHFALGSCSYVALKRAPAACSCVHILAMACLQLDRMTFRIATQPFQCVRIQMHSIAQLLCGIERLPNQRGRRALESNILLMFATTQWGVSKFDVWQSGYRRVHCAALP